MSPFCLDAGSRRHARQVIVFALLGLSALVASFVCFGNVRWGPSASFFADFSYAAGLQSGSPVKVGGICIGHVSGLTLLTAQARPPAAPPRASPGQHEPPIVRATLRIAKSAAAHVTGNSQWSVVTTGIIGDAFVELSPGTGAGCMEQSTLRGVDAPHLHRMALATETVLQQLAPLFEPASDSVGLGLAGQLVQAVTHLLVSHRPSLDALFRDGAAAAGDVRVAAAAARGALGDGAALKRLFERAQHTGQAIDRDYPALQAQTSRLLSRLESLAERLDAQLSPDQLSTWTTDVSQILRSVAALSKDAQSMLEATAKGEGAVGRALRDPDLYEDLKALIHDLRQHPYKLIWRK